MKNRTSILLKKITYERKQFILEIVVISNGRRAAKREFDLAVEI